MTIEMSRWQAGEMKRTYQIFKNHTDTLAQRTDLSPDEKGDFYMRLFETYKRRVFGILTNKTEKCTH